MLEPGETSAMSFWDHLDVFRRSVVKITVITVAFGVISFFFKEELFRIILVPKSDDYIVYRLFRLVNLWFVPGFGEDHFLVKLINTGLAQLFIIHMRAAI